MTRDAEIPTIFNPGSGSGAFGSRRGTKGLTPNVVVTSSDDRSINGPIPGSGSPVLSIHSPAPQTPHVQHADSVASSQQSQHDPSETFNVSTNNERNEGNGTIHKIKKCSGSCCSKSARKIYFGVCVTICVTASWVGATHCIKYLYIRRPPMSTGYTIYRSNLTYLGMVPGQAFKNTYEYTYNAPFFTTWFCTNWTILFFPLYFMCRLITNRCRSGTDILVESIRNFRDRGFTLGRFLTRCSLFCLLWVGTNYMYIHSLRILLTTDVMVLFATNVACVYLLSWVILHEQFVGVRIVAVILCDTGIALLAYMDGITGSPTLGGVVLAASAAAGSAVYKVLFKKVIGDATYGQVAMFFSFIGLLNALLLWPVCLTLYFMGVEIFSWERMPWIVLLAASALSLVANLLGNFSVALTYDLFITLGLITAVPVSAALDVVLYGAKFAGMKLAGIILISVGFFLVMFPDNWPDYITRLLRWAIRPCVRPSRHNHHPLINQQHAQNVHHNKQSGQK